MTDPSFNLWPHVGTWSHGTMRPEHIADTVIPIAMGIADAVDERQRADDNETIGKIVNACNILRTVRKDPDHDGAVEDYMAAIDELADALIALDDRFILATHPGDGSDLGLWPRSLFDDDE